MKHWTEKFFVEGGELWLRVMNAYWDSGKRVVNRITKILNNFGIKKGKILELGCGNGRICIPLARKGFDVTGIDISPLYIKDAEKKAKRRGVSVRFITGDMRRVDKIFKREKFDVVISIWTSIGYYDKKTDQRIFKKVNKLLKKKGLFLILATQSKEWLLRNFYPARVQEAGDTVILTYTDFDPLRSKIKDRWVFYERKGKDLIYLGESLLNLRIYSHQEIIEMMENAGFELLGAYDSLRTLEESKGRGSMNMVFKKSKEISIP